MYVVFLEIVCVCVVFYRVCGCSVFRGCVVFLQRLYCVCSVCRESVCSVFTECVCVVSLECVCSVSESVCVVFLGCV